MERHSGKFASGERLFGAPRGTRTHLKPLRVNTCSYGKWPSYLRFCSDGQEGLSERQRRKVRAATTRFCRASPKGPAVSTIVGPSLWVGRARGGAR
jgi:hypothetical protein